jgi:predicted ATP-binding protein involved in virulence
MKPSIKLQSLAISNFRAIEDFALPRDGLGWNEHMPDVLLLGGENGSGKTTVLELIYGGLQAAIIRNFDVPKNPWLAFPDSTELRFNFEIPTQTKTLLLSITGSNTVSSLSGMMQLHEDSDRTQVVRFSGNNKPTHNFPSGAFRQPLIKDASTPNPASALGTGILYIPSERSLDIPPESLKTPGQIEPHDAFFWKWERPKEWKDSLEALLFSTRWADLNAREAGQPATLFASYQAAFEHFFADKKLTWTPKGELVVTTAGGAQHPLDALSSGEKQVLLLCAEIHRRWRPGSLVLIDEPELHLHTRWLTELWRFLVKTQKERGGQLIVATQSNHLFRIADPECKAIIGRNGL